MGTPLTNATQNADLDLAATDIEAYLHRHEHKTLLRFITCGSVDDGKSTLIGRLLYESQQIFSDQLEAVTADSRTMGTQGGELDLALLVDGLAAEREQGITIDVAYRFFSTDKRKFIVADTPGHEQYTRNMVTGASTADLAVILVDARKGVLTQTRRHSYLVSLLGIRQVVLAINKVDAIDYDQDRIAAIDADYREFAASIGLENVTTIPTSALLGDNILTRSANTPWYDGPTLLGHLENVPVPDLAAETAFRMPVQTVIRPDLDFRGFAGQLTAGRIRPGDEVRVLPGGQTTAVAGIHTLDGELPEAEAGQSVTLTLADEIDVSRGDVLAAAGNPPEVADQFEADVVWMAEEPLVPGRHYLLKIGTRTVGATVSPPKHRVDVNTLAHVAANTLELNEIGVATLTLDRAVPFEPYTQDRNLGGGILIDRLTNNTVGAVLLHFALRRSTNVHWQAVDVDREARASLAGHRPRVVWFTGISGAGKSTLANLVERRLHADGVRTYLLDGDNVRHGLNKDLGFTDADRIENIRRVGEVASMMADAGIVVLVSLISPFAEERDQVRAKLAEGEFVEVYVDTPFEVAAARDRKGLYRKAAQGELPNLTGTGSAYEPPADPEVHVRTTEVDAETAATQVVDYLNRTGLRP